MTEEKTLEHLSFFRIREEIAKKCVSFEGSLFVKNIVPLKIKDKDEIAKRKKICAEWLLIFSSQSPFFLSSWETVFDAVKMLKVQGSTLSVESFYALKTFCDSCLTFVSLVRKNCNSLSIPALTKEADSLPYQVILESEREISNIIDTDGKMRDLPALSEIKRKISQIKSEINGAIKKITSDSAMNSILETNVPAFKENRLVVAIKSNERGRISGIVHGVSASGKTVYLEPEEAVRKNNELLSEEFRLRAEERKILSALSQKIHPFYDSLKNALEKMAYLDAFCAAAKWGKENDAMIVQSVSEKPARLLFARHPILGKNAIPISISFLPKKKILILTGANAGGKTVAIKTFALLSLLNQAGFPVTAQSETNLPFFDDVFSDIGDEQSIDNSLSTFSAHMKNISGALQNATEHSLVLLDELASGTDSIEGGAIAMSILDFLIEKKSTVLVTTHNGALKKYGWTNEQCMNASVEFDSTSFRPTYKILEGIAGESRAIDVAAVSGLPEKVILGAKKYTTEESADVSVIIKTLSEMQKEAEHRLEAISEKEKKIAQKEARMLEKEADFLEREARFLEKEARNESDFVRAARSKIENLVRELREGEITREKNLKVRALVDDLTKEARKKQTESEEKRLLFEEAKKKSEDALIIFENGMKISKQTEKERGKSAKKTKSRTKNRDALKIAKQAISEEEIEEIKKGQKKDKVLFQKELIFESGVEVLAGSAKKRGTLIRKESSGKWLVSIGILKMTFKEKDLILLGKPQFESKADYTVEFSGKNEAGIFSKEGDYPAFELRLIGLREEEAMKVLRRQLDLCAIRDFHAFSIIHGKGNGILQQAVHDFLSHYPSVKDFRFAPPEDGGFGKTYVELA